MQHFRYENNLCNSIECQIIGLLDSKDNPPKLIQESKTLNAFYEKNQDQLKTLGDWIWFNDEDGKKSIIIHCGKTEVFNADAIKQVIQKMAQVFKQQPWSNLLLSLPQAQGLSAEAQLKLMIITIESCYYQFLNYKSDPSPCHLTQVYHDTSVHESLFKEAQAIVQGIQLCQNLANTPANDCTPIDLEHAAQQLTKEFSSISCHALDENDMQKLGMHTLLAVAKGSTNPPRLIELHYQQSKSAPIVLVGKGITFDSGGINIKPSEGMYEMKYDMSGAAAVLGVMKAIAMMNLPVHVVGILACAENMPSGSATRPGDVIKSFQGTTIEITNTDAEGRLVLADAMSYAQKYQPRVIIDIATLTGAVIVALGSVYSGLMTPDEKLANSLLNASQNAFDKLWRLPMDKEYEECLNSPVADLMNSHNSRAAGSIVAAHFLKNFAKGCAWAHLDIAGSAWISGANRQATGRPVALLIEWIKNYHAN